MILKEAYRYQNYLNDLLDEAETYLTDGRFIRAFLMRCRETVISHVSWAWEKWFDSIHSQLDSVLVKFTFGKIR